MEALHRFLAIVLADLRERTRSARFWVVLGLLMAASWRCFPPMDAGYLVLSLPGGARGYYTSAWVGLVLAMVSSSLLSLFGFYLVRGTLVRDIETRVWQLLVATPMTRRGFLLAKWASHMTVFALVMLGGVLVGLAAQWLRAEDRSIDLLEMTKPILLLSLPSLAVTAMFAVWFDLVPWLRRTAGNILFFVLWVTMLSAPLANLATRSDSVLRHSWVSDQDGFAMVARDFHRVREAQTGQPQGYGFSIGHGRLKQAPVRFDWRHWRVRGADVFGRALWLLLALAGVAAAAPCLDWAAGRGSAAQERRDRPGRRLRLLEWLLWPLDRAPLGRLVAAEVRLVLRQRRILWWLAAIVAMAVQAFGNGNASAQAIVVAWVLALDVLARGALREHASGTGGLVYVAAGILPRLLATRFAVAGLLVLGLSFPGLVRLAMHSPVSGLAVLAAGVSVVGWGLAFGALCRNPRPYELLLVVLVYLALNGMPVFDFVLQPWQTAAWHAALLLPAAATLAWAWPRLARIRAGG